jgi:hypothetical protein
MKKIIFISFCFFLVCVSVLGQKNTPDTILLGIYVKNISNISSQDYSYDADLYLWSNSNDSSELFKQIEIINAKKMEETSPFVEKDGDGIKYVSYSAAKLKLRHNWDLFKYPFDKQYLDLIIEAQDGRDYKVIFPDINGFKLDSTLSIPGWEINDKTVSTGQTIYPVNFGYHKSIFIDSSFSRITYTIQLSRKGWGLYFKIFSSLYLAFLVSFIAFFIRVDYVDPRFGVSIGGLFASVANKYVVDSSIPESNGILMIDIVHILNFTLIFLTILASTISLKYYTQGSIKKSIKLDRLFAIITISLYIIGNIISLFWGFSVV